MASAIDSASPRWRSATRRRSISTSCDCRARCSQSLARRPAKPFSSACATAFESICVAKWEPGRDIQVNAVIGRRRPLHVGSSKVLLAYLDETEREAFLRGPLERFTPNTIVDPKKLRQKVEQIRRTGMQVSRGEVTEDLISITAPVFGADGRIAATLNVAAPANRAPESRHAEIGEQVKDAARRISQAIGFRS